MGLFRPRKIMPAGRRSGAGREHVDANPSRCEVEDPAPREVANRGLACTVDAETRRASDCGGGPCEDDRAAVLEQRQRFLNSEKGPFHIGRKRPVEVFLSDRSERYELTASCIGEKYINLAGLVAHDRK